MEKFIGLVKWNTFSTKYYSGVFNFSQARKDTSIGFE